jgi:chromosomal replication initiation ATPase DnaA
MKELIKQIKEEIFAIEEHAILAQRSHILNCDVLLGDDIDIIVNKAKLIQCFIEELEKEIE